jgi:hypothetical protein
MDALEAEQTALAALQQEKDTQLQVVMGVRFCALLL